jgi:glycosyltransferase involved in cell wall biosynthesis
LPPTLLFLGDLDERHGADLLLRAMPAILSHHPQIRLTMIGDGPLAEPLAAYSRYLQLEEVISFLPTPEKNTLVHLMDRADVVVVPGREADSPATIWAAWLAHKPVVVTHEAASGWAEHERDALLVYPSENSIAAAVVRILNDPELARKLGQAGHQRLRTDSPKWSTRAVSPLDEAPPNPDPDLYPP